MHGADYNPDQWQHDPLVLEEDIRMMKLAKCNVMAVGIFACSALEPEEGVFTFDWLDRVLDTFAANGIYAWLATASGARPAWMAEQESAQFHKRKRMSGYKFQHPFLLPLKGIGTSITKTLSNMNLIQRRKVVTLHEIRHK